MTKRKHNSRFMLFFGALFLALGLLSATKHEIKKLQAEPIAAESDVYFKPHANWKQNKARFAMYLFKGGSNPYSDWVRLDKQPGLRDIYHALTPDKEYDQLIFCRLDPNIDEDSFDTGPGKPLWNQTGNLDYIDSEELYTLNGGVGDSVTGSWSTFNPYFHAYSPIPANQDLYYRSKPAWGEDKVAAYFFNDDENAFLLFASFSLFATLIGFYKFKKKPE